MKKHYFFYGILLGLLLLILQITKYRVIFNDIGVEMFALTIATMFTIIGIWLGVTFYNKKGKSLLISQHDTLSLLSKREVDVLLLLSEGGSNQEIADTLFISLNTAKTHISNIYQKLNAKRRTQAVKKAREMGLIPNNIKQEPTNHLKV